MELSPLYKVLLKEVKGRMRLCDALGCTKPATRSGNNAKFRLLYRCEQHSPPELKEHAWAQVIRIIDDIESQEKPHGLQEQGQGKEEVVL